MDCLLAALRGFLSACFAFAPSGIIREKWKFCLSDIQSGICRYYLQTIGYTDKINGEPFNREIFDSCRERAENLREQIQTLKSKYSFVQGCVSFPKDLILLEGSEIEYDAGNNCFHFEVIFGGEELTDQIKQNKLAA